MTIIWKVEIVFVHIRVLSTWKYNNSIEGLLSCTCHFILQDCDKYVIIFTFKKMYLNAY
jgi:hypothetical protein